jgi:membrane-associated phospholipid phosphatase
MDVLYSWGIEVIEGMQALGGPTLDALFKAITFVGNEEFYLLLLPLVFWCIDERLGAKLIYLLLIAGFINFALKELFAQPRPFVMQPGINLVEADGYGLPSGHSQLAVVIWGALALELRKSWSWFAALGLAVLIGVSRVYLGVHFPTDVLAGWAVGALILMLVALVRPRIGGKTGRLSVPPTLLLISTVVTIALLFIRSKNIVSSLAALWGFGLGQLILSRYVPHTIGGMPWKRVLRYPLGLIGMAAVYLGLKTLFPAEGEELYLLFRIIRYALLGLWVGLAAPLLFRSLRLSTTGGQPTREQ